MDDNKTTDLPAVGLPIEELPSVKLLPVVQECSLALPAVKTQSGMQATLEHQKACLQPVGMSHLNVTIKPQLV